MEQGEDGGPTRPSLVISPTAAWRGTHKELTKLGRVPPPHLLTVPCLS